MNTVGRWARVMQINGNWYAEYGWEGGLRDTVYCRSEQIAVNFVLMWTDALPSDARWQERD